MAKRKKRSTGERDVSTIANGLNSLLRPVKPMVSVTDYESLLSPLREVEDRREYHPERAFRPARVVYGGRGAQRVVAKRKRSLVVPAGLQFDVGRDVAKCVRRKDRREVLFAKRKTGAGSRAKRRRRDFWSSISC